MDEIRDPVVFIRLYLAGHVVGNRLVRQRLLELGPFDFPADCKDAGRAVAESLQRYADQLATVKRTRRKK